MDISRKYKPGKTIPRIVLKMTWKWTGQPIDDTVTVLINGENVNSFNLPCASSCTPLHPQPTLVPDVVKPKQMDLIQELKSLPWSDVYDMAIQLEVPIKPYRTLRSNTVIHPADFQL